MQQRSSPLLWHAGKLKGWAHVQFESEGAVERACGLNGMELIGRPLYIDAATAGRAPVTEPGKPVEGCWFCLSNPNADTDLVVSIGTSSMHAKPGSLLSLSRCLLT